jgi:hypothetical protein
MVCQDLTKDLEKALGGDVLDRQFTPESLEKPDTPIEPGIEIKVGK